ncbi:MAG: NAD(P)/FAD-dependent oxidoreductase [Pseudomonadota bacterium]
MAPTRRHQIRRNRPRSDAVKPLPPGAHVVVVGAGFAGIGAAERLIEAGYAVDLIEAADRVGGRAHTVQLGDFPADLGANWLRLTNNELLPIAKDLGLVSASTDMQNATAVISGKGEPADATALEHDLEAALTLPYLWHRTQRLFGARPRVKSVAALVGERLERADAIGCAGQRMLMAMSAADLDDLSGDVLIGANGGDSDDGEDIPELIEPTVVGGMQALLKALIQKSNPHLNEAAESVSRTNDGVRVETTRRVIEADAAIITVSVGVLKSGRITFDPGLPKSHSDALAGMDMGTLTKLWIQYPTASWSLETNTTAFCDAPDIHLVIDFSKSHGAPVLLGAIAGRQGRVLEDLSEAEAQEFFHDYLQTQLGQSLPAPTGFAMNRWGKDPLTGGAYMYPNVNFRSEDNKKLRAPIAERILLAGEALADTIGYVDTAWSDGRRAADLLIS